MISKLHIKINAEESGQRLDKVIALHAPTSSRSWIAEAIEQGRVRLNEALPSKGVRVQEGDDALVEGLLENSDLRVLPNPNLPLTILYEDPFLLALNKPAGMQVHPIHPDEMDTLANALIARYPELAGIGDQPLFPALIHRLDGDTSGIVLAARTAEAYDFLRRQFKERKTKKVYVALVHGNVTASGTQISLLSHDPRHPGRMMVEKNPAKPRGVNPLRAVSEHQVRRRYPGYTFLEITIHTGITHQIRCQLADAGFPIVGDKTYGDKDRPDGELPLKRQFLHAFSIEFEHPETHAMTCLEAPLPTDLQAVMNRLENNRRRPHYKSHKGN